MAFSLVERDKVVEVVPATRVPEGEPLERTGLDESELTVMVAVELEVRVPSVPESRRT